MSTKKQNSNAEATIKDLEDVHKLKNEKRYDEAISLLKKVINSHEKHKKRLAPPAQYEQLAILYRKQKKYKEEVDLLEYYQEHAANEGERFEDRLLRAKEMNDKVTPDRKDEKELQILNKYIKSTDSKYKAKKSKINLKEFDKLDAKYNFYNKAIDCDEVPTFAPPIYSPEEELSNDILSFYDYWKKNWRQNKPVKLQGNHGYLNKYVNDYLDSIYNKHKKKYKNKTKKINESMKIHFNIFEEICNNVNYVKNDTSTSDPIKDYRQHVLENLQPDINKLRKELFKIKETYKNETFPNEPNLINNHVSMSIVHTYLLSNEYLLALSFISNEYHNINKTYSKGKSLLDINFLLSLKYSIGEPISGKELLRLGITNKKYNQILREDFDGLCTALDKIISQFEIYNDIDILSIIINECSYFFDNYSSTFFLAQKTHLPPANLKLYKFNKLYKLSYLVKNWLDEAENEVRIKHNMPKIGEGWISETQLCNIITELLPNYKIYRNARPSYLEGLEIDIYIPQLDLGIEYQGEQHFHSIEHFGGDKALEYRQYLDYKKKQLCKQNNIHLIEFYYYENLNHNSVKDKLSRLVDFK